MRKIYCVFVSVQYRRKSSDVTGWVWMFLANPKEKFLSGKTVTTIVNP